MKNKWIYLVSLGMMFVAPVVNAVEICGNLAQGQIIRGHTERYTKVICNDKIYRVSPFGEFLIAFGRDDNLKQNIVLKAENGKMETVPLELEETSWDVQNLKGVPQRKVTPSKDDEKAIGLERNLLVNALTTDVESTYWSDGFMIPVEGRTSGNFGGQRIMNGKKMNPHAGMDIAALEGTPVVASGEGIVTLKAGNLFYSGNVIVIDHGFGLQTIYAHLSEIGVQDGQKVKKGEVIGKVGKTGRVTGAHLHWGASMKGVKFNPLSLISLKDNNFCFNL